MDVSQPLDDIDSVLTPVYHRGKWTFPSKGSLKRAYLPSISQGEMDVSQHPAFVG